MINLVTLQVFRLGRKIQNDGSSAVRFNEISFQDALFLSTSMKTHFEHGWPCPFKITWH